MRDLELISQLQAYNMSHVTEYRVTHIYKCWQSCYDKNNGVQADKVSTT